MLALYRTLKRQYILVHTRAVDPITRATALNTKFKASDSPGVINCINTHVIHHAICNANNIHKMIFEPLKKFNLDSYVLFRFPILEM